MPHCCVIYYVELKFWESWAPACEFFSSFIRGDDLEDRPGMRIFRNAGFLYVRIELCDRIDDH